MNVNFEQKDSFRNKAYVVRLELREAFKTIFPVLLNHFLLVFVKMEEKESFTFNVRIIALGRSRWDPKLIEWKAKEHCQCCEGFEGED